MSKTGLFLAAALLGSCATNLLLAGQQEVLNHEQLPLSVHSVRIDSGATGGSGRLVGVAQNSTKETVRFVTVKLLHFSASGSISGSQMFTVPLTVNAENSAELSIEISGAALQRSAFTAVGFLSVASESNEWAVTDDAFERNARQRLGVPAKQ